MNLAGYFRVSREDTALDKFAVEKYRNKLLEYGVSEEYIFYDFSSGGDTDRAEYQKVLNLIRSGQSDRLVVPMQSRLNRNLINSELLAEDLAQAGAKLTILETGVTLDPKIPGDRLLYQINALFDHQVLSQHKLTNAENAKEMRRLRKLNQVPFGYVLERGKPKIDRDGFVCLLEEKKERSPSDILLELIELIISTKHLTNSVREIHRRYGVPDFLQHQIKDRTKRPRLYGGKDNRLKHRKPLHFSHNAVKILLSNPLLAGDVVYFRRNPQKPTVTIPNAYPDCAILTRTQYQQLQIAIANRNYKSPQKHNYPYSALIYCAICGGKCYSDRGGKLKDGSRELYYFCKNKRHGCPAKRIRASDIEKAVIKTLTAKHESISYLAITDDRSVDSPEIIKLQTEIAQLEALNSDNEHIVKAIVSNREKIKQLREQELLGAEVKQENIELLRSIFSNPMYWETLPDDDKREINQMLIKRIEIGLEDGKAYVERVLLSI